MWNTIRKVAIAAGFGTGLAGVVVAGTAAVVTAVNDMPLWMTAAMLLIAILAGTMAFTFVGQLLEMWGQELLELVDDETEPVTETYPAGPGPLAVFRDEEWRP